VRNRTGELTSNTRSQARSAQQIGRSYVLYAFAVLFFVNILNYLDRSIIAILVEPIKRELALTDTQVGLLTGFAFASVFAIAGVPLGRLADRGNRKNILAAAVFIWGLMTAACGSAASFFAFFLIRMSVGLGEAGGVVTTYSLVADYVPPARRPFAFGLISFGTTMGSVCALALGGWASRALGWRGAFLLAGLPGVLMAALIVLTIREPMRGQSDAVRSEPSKETFWQSVRALWGRSSLFHVIAGGSIAAISNGVLSWLPAFFHRQYGLGPAEIGLHLVFFQGLGSALGTIGGGWLCSRPSGQGARWQMRFAAGTTLLSVPAFAASFLSTSAIWSMAFLIPAFALKFASLGPYSAMIQNLAGATRRSTVAACSYFFVTLLGTGFGPLLVGASSDALSALREPHPLRWALCTTLPFVIWGGFHFLRANQRVLEDLKATNDPLATTQQEN
jgi:predicted MFS family arabinose efflux permease